MKDLAILVDNKNDSTEAQDLLFSMGYKWRGPGEISKSYFYPKMNKYFIFMNKNEMDLQMAGYFAGSSRSYTESRFKEITLPELRDLVVLKRNSIDDATHTDGHYSFYVGKDKNYFFSSCDKAWRGTWKNVDILKPIEKPMKEYLDPKRNYELCLSDEDLTKEGMIKIPEKWMNFVYKLPNGDIRFSDNFVSTTADHIIWQRHTHPEELPFIDDEPKITTAKGSELDYIAKIHDMRDRYNGESDEDYRYQLEHYISRKEPSLNDQYAEIEKVRQSHRTASEIADSALKHIRERAETYDQPTGERSAAKTAKAFNAITGKDITESEVWLLLQLLKDVRQWSREDYHQDSAEDCIAYAALKAESLEGGE